jgi:hypothetical protein
MRTRAASAGLALLAGVAMAAGCGDVGESEGTPSEAKGVGIVRAGSTAQFASCRDWRNGSVEDRYATIEDIRGQLTPQSSETADSDLSDAAAYELFEHSCQERYASTLRLYKLYARAQAFAPLTTDVEG